MGNPLKDALKAAIKGGPAPAGSTAASSTTAAATSPGPAPAPAAPPPAPTAGAVGSRDLASLRARLAGQLSGVNPPESKVPEDAVEPRTVPTADGGATPAPGWVETKAGTVVRAPEAGAPAPESGAGAPATPSPANTTELTRGQKAALTRAANKAKVSSAPSGDAPAAAAAPSGTASADQIADILVSLGRIAAALEQIAAVADGFRGRE